MLITRSRTRMAWAVLVLGLTACSDSSIVPPGPTPPVPVTPAAPPTPTPAPTPAPTVSVLADATLSGMVYEVVGESPRTIAGIAGASVYCEPCGESTHNFADTDSNGEYVFPRGVWTEGRPAFPIRVLVRKDGYQDPDGLAKPTPPNPSGPGWREVVINGDTRFDVELVRR